MKKNKDYSKQAFGRIKKDYREYIKNSQIKEGELKQRCFFFSVCLQINKYLLSKDFDLLSKEDNIMNAFIEFMFRNTIFIPNNQKIEESFIGTIHSKEEIENHFVQLKEFNKEDEDKIKIIDSLEVIVKDLISKDAFRFNFGKEE